MCSEIYILNLLLSTIAIEKKPPWTCKITSNTEKKSNNVNESKSPTAMHGGNRLKNKDNEMNFKDYLWIR